MMRWSRSGVLDRIFERLQRSQLMLVRIEVISLDSTIVKVHPDRTGTPQKNGQQAIGRSCGGWSTKVHMVAADACNVLTWSLTADQAGDAPEGRQLIQALGPHHGGVALLVDIVNPSNN
jgi:hypothetical protein